MNHLQYHLKQSSNHIPQLENTNNERINEFEKVTQELFKLVFERLDQLEKITPSLPKKRKKIELKNN